MAAKVKADYENGVAAGITGTPGCRRLWPGFSRTTESDTATSMPPRVGAAQLIN